MKKSILLIIIVICLSSCQFLQNIFGDQNSKRNKQPITNGDSLSLDILNSTITAKLHKVSYDTNLPDVEINGFQLSNSYINSAPFLVGKLVQIDKSNPKPALIFISDFNYLTGYDKLTNDLINNRPYFDTYIEKGASANVDIVKKATANIKADESLHIIYQTTLSSVPKGEFIDKKRLDEDAITYNLKNFPNLAIINSVMVNRLTYSKFSKFTGNISGASTIVNMNGNMYYQTGNELNEYELIVTTSTVPFKLTGKPDTLKIKKTPFDELIKADVIIHDIK